MDRSIEISGRSIMYLFYVVSLAIVPLLGYAIVWPIDDIGSVGQAALLAVVVLAMGADLWYWRSGSLAEHLETAAKRDLPYDITYRPNADPGAAARDYWTKAVRRLPGDDDE